MEDLVPGCPREVRLQAVSLETGLPESETAAALALRKGPTETLFDNSSYGSLFSLCQLPHLFVKGIWYLDGCLHMANHIILYGKMSRYSEKHSRPHDVSVIVFHASDVNNYPAGKSRLIKESIIDQANAFENLSNCLLAAVRDQG